MLPLFQRRPLIFQPANTKLNSAHILKGLAEDEEGTGTGLVCLQS